MRGLGTYLFPVNNEEEPILENGDVARAEPAVLEGVPVRLVVLPVALGDHGALDPYLARLARLDVPVVVIDEARITASYEAADGTLW